MQLIVSGDETRGWRVHNMRGEAISRPFTKVEDALAEMDAVYGLAKTESPLNRAEIFKIMTGM